MINLKNGSASLLLGAVLLATTSIYAQPYKLAKSADELSGPQHELLSLPGGDLITITYPYDDEKVPVIVTRFDHSLKQKYTHPNLELNHENFRSAVLTGDRLFLLCTNKEGAVNRYEVNENTGALTGSPTPLFELPGKPDDCEFLSGSTLGGNWHFLLAKGHTKREKGLILQGAILDQQGNKTASFTYTTPEDRDDIDQVDVIPNDKGGLFLIYDVIVKTSKDAFTPLVYNVVTVDATGKSNAFALTGRPAGDLRAISWVAQENRLLFTGLLAPAKKGGFRSVCSGTVDPAQHKVADVRVTDLASLMAQAPPPFKGWVSEYTSLVKTISLPDGSRTLVLEVRGDRDFQSHYAPTPNANNSALANGSLASYSYTFYDRKNIYLLKVDGSNTPQWLNIVTKKQVEADVVISTGTAATTDAKGNILLFFVDSKNNALPAAPTDKTIVGVDGLQYKQNVLACVSVAPDGVEKKQFLEDQPDVEFRPILSKSVPAAGNDLCFVAIKVKKAFTVEKTMNHSHFRLGTITIPR